MTIAVKISFILIIIGPNDLSRYGLQLKKGVDILVLQRKLNHDPASTPCKPRLYTLFNSFLQVHCGIIVI